VSDVSDVSDATAGRLRALAVVIGCAGIGFGLWELVVVSPRATRPVAAISWLAAGLVVHDAVLAPLAVVVGLVVSRALKGAVARVVGVGLFVAICIIVVAVPALLTPGVPGNPSATPRDYLGGLTVALVVVAVVTAVWAWLARRATEPGDVPRR
jgi:hypothetical protein